jgi:hypothetical protein
MLVLSLGKIMYSAFPCLYPCMRQRDFAVSQRRRWQEYRGPLEAPILAHEVHVLP